MSGRTVLQALDEAWRKFGPFVLEQLTAANVDEASREKIRGYLERDVLIFVSMLQDFMLKHGAAITAKDEAYFRAFLPPEFRDVKIQPAALEKLFLFGRVFQSLINDIAKE